MRVIAGSATTGDRGRSTGKRVTVLYLVVAPGKRGCALVHVRGGGGGGGDCGFCDDRGQGTFEPAKSCYISWLRPRFHRKGAKSSAHFFVAELGLH